MRASVGLSDGGARALLESLEGARDWRRVARSFYEVDVLDAAEAVIGAALRAELERLFGLARIAVSELLELQLLRSATVHFHRFTAGTGAGLHADSSAAEARLVLFVTRCWRPADGGAFLLASPSSRRASVIEPIHNSAVLFPTARSLHAVTEQRSGTRFSLVASFRSDS